MPAKVLVAYYSRSGTTAAAAEAIAKEIGADVEKIEDKKNRSGLLGAIRAGKDVFLNKLADIEMPQKDPSQYDLIVIGTPIWASAMSLPVKAYITRLKHKFNKVALFCTGGGFGSKKAFKDMAYLCGKQPVATLSISHISYFSGGYRKNIPKFTKELRQHL